ncbi:hypothetical protein HDE68_000525 [Pedobacter cryoconitis]|uniref:Outer membrane protein beta-barrel domain-containing protein n=1 Tax=Pedobacter cryoconitis TaxID=188932 RepID=A0A7W8ZIQ0_9SPHI|nr:hypothetical protein [Pedobacter cryoconitis]MBB5634640.1 hypothetical protein [Pedobacter cryoconitis]
MKQGLLSTCLFLFLSLHAFSQANSIYSLGLSAFSILQLPRIADQNPLKYIHTSINGGIFKIDDRQINYRLSGRFLNQSIDFQNDCNNCNIDQGKVTDYEVKLGFEKSISYSWIQPYFAFDIGYRYNRFQGIQNTVNLQRVTASVSQLETTKSGLVLVPSLGIRITPIEMLSLFAEGSLEFYYSSLHTRLITQNSSALMTENSEAKKEFLFSPLTVGIQIHLGSRN